MAAATTQLCHLITGEYTEHPSI